MCEICGFLGDTVEREQASGHMMRAIWYRGPDRHDAGFEFRARFEIWLTDFAKNCFDMEERLNKFSDEQFIQPRICAEASQILLIAEQNLKFCSPSQRKTLRNGGNDEKYIYKKSEEKRDFHMDMCSCFHNQYWNDDRLFNDKRKCRGWI